MSVVEARKRVKEVEYPFNMIYKMLESNIDLANEIYKSEYSKYGEYFCFSDFRGSVEYILYKALTPRERLVLQYRFKELKTMEECGKLLGMCKERIRQIEAKALRKLRSDKNIQYFKIGVSGIIENIKDEYKEKLNNVTNEYLKQMSSNNESKKLAPILIEDLDLSVRAYNRLSRGDIKTVVDLLDLTYEDLLNIRNLGKYTADEIVKKLDMYGYHLKESESINI